ncbi:MAG: EamA family transporter, partial [Ilumatobacteraceae bacterium]
MVIVLALVSALAYGTGDYCGGRATRSVQLLVVSIVTQTTSTALALALVAIDASAFPSGATVAWSIAAGLMSLTGFLTFYEALARGSMTVVAPLTAVVSAIVPVIVGMASGERPSALAIVGVLIALGAVALVSGIGGRAERRTPPRIAAMALIAGVAFGLLFVFLDRTDDGSGFWPLGISQST